MKAKKKYNKVSKPHEKFFMGGFTNDGQFINAITNKDKDKK